MLELSVTKGLDEHGFEFELTRDSVAESFSQTLFPVSLQEVEELLKEAAAELNPPPWQASLQQLCPALESLGDALFRLLPAGLRHRLEECEAGLSLRLLNETELPWDLIRWQRMFLQQRFRVHERAPQAAPALPATDEPPRALLVVDPENLLPGAGEAAERLVAALQPRIAVERLDGGAATLAELHRRFTEGRFGLVYIQGYADHRGLRLADGVLDARELRRYQTPFLPRLVIVDAVGPAQLSRGRLWARWFHHLGVESVLVRRWNRPTGCALLEAWLAGQLPLDEALRRDASHGFWLYGRPARPSELSACRPSLPATLESALKPSFILAVVGGPQAGREIPLFPQMLGRGKGLVLGRPGPRSNDIDLEDPALANQAARIELSEGGLRLVNLSADRDKVKVNGLATSEAPLEGGEELCLGDTVIELRRVGEAAVSARPHSTRSFRLEVTRGSGPDLQKRLELGPGVAVVGRSPDCSLCLHDPSVSRQHFSLIYRDGNFYASRVGSRPTVLNGVELEGEKELRHGDELVLSGDTALTFLDVART